MISTHILDTTKGMPASGVMVELHYLQNNQWQVVGKNTTNQDGRAVFDCKKLIGSYRLNFHVDTYFVNQESFFENITVMFKVANIDRKYHVPLLLNPFGYSTYRGS